MKRVLARFLAVLALLAGTVAFADTRCFVCGNEPQGTVYLVQDQVTLQKVDVCESCQKKFQECFLCGLPANTNSLRFKALADGRVICARDATDVVVDEDEGLRIFEESRSQADRMYSRFTGFPETNIVVEMVDRIHLQELFTLAGNDYHCPNILGFTQSATNAHRLKHRISLMTGLPLPSLRGVCVHELAHAWVAENVTTNRPVPLAREAQEGFCELLAYRHLDALGDTNATAKILRNLYTRGQVQLFIAAANSYGFNDVVDWMKFGADPRLSADDAQGIHRVEKPKLNPTRPAEGSAWVLPAAPRPAAPARLVLNAILWDAARPTVLINSRSFGPQEEGSVRLGTSSLTIRCLTIRSNSVTVQVNGGPPQDLILGGN